MRYIRAGTSEKNMSRESDTSSEEREFWNSTQRLRKTEDQVEKDKHFEHRSAEAVRQALGKRARQL